MKKMKGFRTLLAYILAGVMIFSAVPVLAEEPAADAPAAEAEAQEPACTTLIRVEDGVVYKYNDATGEWDPDEDLTRDLKLDGDLAADILVNIVQGDGLDWAPALEASSAEQNTSFTVDGSVAIQHDGNSCGDEVEAVEVIANGQETVVTVEEDITAVSTCQTEESEGEYSEDEPPFAEADALALEVCSISESGEKTEGEETLAKAKAEGSVTAEAVAAGTAGYLDADAKALDVSADGENASAAVNIGEAVSAEASATQTGTGTEEISARAEATALEVEASGEGASSVVKIGEGVSAEASAEIGNGSADAYADGVVAGNWEGDEGASVVIEIGEGISAEATATATGEDGGTEADAAALSVHGNGTYEITVKEDVAATAKAPDGQALAKSVEASTSGGEITIHIEGSATAEIVAADHEFVLEEYNGYEGAYAVSASASGGTVTVDVDEKIAAISSVAGDAPLAIEANAYGEDGEVLVTAGEGVEGQVFIQAVNGSHSVVTVENGGITAETGGVVPEQEAVFVYADNGGQAEISVTGDTAVSNSEEVPVVHAVGMVSREGSEGEESSITAVFEGNVTAELNEISDTTAETETVAISLENENGAMDVAVEGDVTAKGAKDNFGIYVEAAEGTDTDILVDGTVSAAEGAIVLSGETTKIGENVTLTVWKLETDEGVDMVAVGARDEETGKIVFAEDNAAKEQAEEAEKNIQYIIRVDAGQTDLIQTEGTGSYTGANGKTYNVAKEGETVVVKLNIPTGHVITGVYWDEDQTSDLLQDENGNYYLIVPRGGGVVLSVEMEEEKKEESKQAEPAAEPSEKPEQQEKPAAEPEKQGKPAAEPSEKPEQQEKPAAEPAKEPEKQDPSAPADIQNAEEIVLNAQTDGPAAAAPPARLPQTKQAVLKIRDLTDKVEITFFNDGTYTAVYEDGSEENGKFALENGELFLVNDNDIKAEKTKMFVTLNPQEQMFEFTLIPSAADEETVFTFRLTEANKGVLENTLP